MSESYRIDFSIANSEQIEAALCQQLERIRLMKNITQAQLAEEAGVSLPTISRLAKGKGVSLDTFIRVMMALEIQQNLAALLPDPSVRPADRARNQGRERQRARPKKEPAEPTTWTWGDEKDEDQ
jgi:transcriptional regulator with XRE-family HTH domain